MTVNREVSEGKLVTGSSINVDAARWAMENYRREAAWNEWFCGAEVIGRNRGRGFQFAAPYILL